GKSMKDNISIAPLEFIPGNYELTVIARDQAGHVVEETIHIEVVLHLSELDELVEHGKDQAYRDEKMENNYCKATDVQKAKNEGSRDKKWNALIHQMEAQLGRKIEKDYIHAWELPVEMKKDS